MEAKYRYVPLLPYSKRRALTLGALFQRCDGIEGEPEENSGKVHRGRNIKRGSPIVVRVAQYPGDCDGRDDVVPLPASLGAVPRRATHAA